MDQITIYQFVYTIVTLLFVIDVFVFAALCLVQMFSKIDNWLLGYYKKKVYQLIDAIAAGMPEELLPAVKINYWSRRALLTVACEEMPRLNKIGRAKLSVVLESQGIFDHLIAMLSSLWLARRLKACYYLGQLNCGKAILKLKKLATDRDYRLSEAALVALAKIGHGSDFSFVLEDLLGDKRFSVERMADIVSEIMQRKPQRLLKLAMETSNQQIKLVAVTALGKIKYEPAFPLFVELLRYPDNEIRVKSAKGLIGSNYQAAVDPLIERLKNDETWVVKVACARALGSLQALEALEALKDGLRHSNWWVRTAASEALSRMGEKIIPFIQHQITIETDRFAIDRLGEVLYFLITEKATGDVKHG